MKSVVTRVMSTSASSSSSAAVQLATAMVEASLVCTVTRADGQEITAKPGGSGSGYGY